MKTKTKFKKQNQKLIFAFVFVFVFIFAFLFIFVFAFSFIFCFCFLKLCVFVNSKWSRCAIDGQLSLDSRRSAIGLRNMAPRLIQICKFDP